MHPARFAVDGDETWWQSPPLSRGMKYNEVNLTIDFGQEFHVAYVYIRMGNSPRPGLWILEKSSDYGKTFVPWQYFSDSESDCITHFGTQSLQPITRDDSVVCTTEYSKIVPLTGGEIPISLLNNRPSSNHYFNSSILQEWTRATNVRFRFLRTKNLLGHLMSVARQDPTVTRRYFYSIKDISIGGRCMCNGHADTCDIQDPTNTNILVCRCQHNTCGNKCETCCPGYQQKAWRQSKSYKLFVCEECNCFGHSYDCLYDAEIDRQHLSLDIHGNYEGGGVCQHCQHNTEGINCNKCKPTFYKPFGKHWNDTDVCQPCQCSYFYSTGNCVEGTGKCECRKEFIAPNCDSCSFGYYDYPDCKPCECYLNGTESLQCESRDGQCTCKYNYGGKYCKECADQYYNFPECNPCECNTLGSISSTCEQKSGNCTCKSNYGGKQCDHCQHGYYSYPSCTYCDCDIIGTQSDICDKTTGTCLCKPGYAGERCDQCIAGYYGYPNCRPCNCSVVGSTSSVCDTTGKCGCLNNFGGQNCDKCSVGFYKYPECLPCNCDGHGAIGISCDYEGRCQCQYNFDGNQCNQCREGFYNFPSCEECNCNPAGVVAAFSGCGSVPAGELCECKERVQGRICDQCKPLFWNLHLNNPEGCEECRCYIPGVLGGNAVCNSESGACICKPFVVSQNCNECADGTYNLLEDSLFGCGDCGCDIGGSISPICNKATGQCSCHSRVIGRTCKEPLKAHYFPTLYQFQYEAEDGRTPSGTPVRFAYDENIFKGYSWRGYAVFSLLQNEIVQEVFIQKPSLYRMVIRYINFNEETVIGTLKITPDNPTDNEQTFKAQFKPSVEPTFVTVSGDAGNAFVFNPGRWILSIEVKKNLLMDYFVLLPEDFYLATILNQNVEEPCKIGEKRLCRQYGYPNVSSFDMSLGSGGLITYGSKIDTLKEYYDNTSHLNELKITNKIPLLNVKQPEITFNVTVQKPGRYVIVINYITPLNDLRTHTINVDSIAQNGKSSGRIIFYACPYTIICRQAVMDKQSGVGVHLIDGNYISITLQAVKANVGIHSVVAVPIEEWSLDYIKPKPICITKDGQCTDAIFPKPPESKKIQFEQDPDVLEHNRTVYKLTNTSSYIYLNPKNDMIDLHGKVASPGTYVFIVQYFQPDYPEFNLDVILQNGEFYEAKLPVTHCPSKSGCRALVTEVNGNTRFSLTENFMITLKEGTLKSVYLDYILIVPEDLYFPRILEEETFDRTGEFIATCGSNHFNIDIEEEGFCRDSVFSITAAYNNGALLCDCDFDGSLNYECDKFGGQCPCREHVIGRKCEACETGYYDFPNCKKCSCPSTALCEASTGQCICPTNVVGELCNQCANFTYGYDPIIGCEHCNCNPLGVDRVLQCDLLNGSCTCKRNIVGRQCDVCAAGYFAYPHCEICECDPRGTTADICDQNSAECLCKKDVTGPNCNLCKEGSFNLQSSNEDGCTECFCFGKTSRCISSNYVQIPIFTMADWVLVNVNETTTSLEVKPLNLSVVDVDKQTTIGADFTQIDMKDKLAYFSTPLAYVGYKLTSYGGFLNYTIFYTIGSGGKATGGADVVLEGGGMFLVHTSYEQPAPAQDYAASLQLVEANFEFLNGMPAKREHLMTALHDLKGIYIRATYWTASVTTKLSNVILDDAIPFQYYNSEGGFKFATSVEQCQCPPGYDGLSCEACAAGFYRVKSGPHGGYCVPCRCNNHADECDVETGQCIGCKHHTTGENCDKCEVGYHGHAEQGTPMDCLICACPLPVAGNNFASGCEVSADGERISCQCYGGYYGARCQSCAPGFYGRPEQLGEYCKPCECSGNINPNDIGSCDTVTGQCLRCLNNTFGETCALCAPGFYGDAIVAKDCQPCICDKIGTGRCNSYTGLCECKPNVVGEKCDRCELEHYGFNSGYGCLPCKCGVASLSMQCDDFSGQCRCETGVAGRACERCAPGFWNYTSQGCVSCGCKSEYSLGFGCNAQTGHCECLPGVVGEKCDQCPYRWAFVPDTGCHKCDKCIHNLLDDTDALHLLIDPYITEFDSVDSGYFTNQRLTHINETLQELKPKVDSLDPNAIDLTTIHQNLDGLEQETQTLTRKSFYCTNNSKALSKEADNVRSQSFVLLDEILQATQEAHEAIDNIDYLSESLLSGEGPKIEAALKDAQDLLEQMKAYDFNDKEMKAGEQFEKATNLTIALKDFQKPVSDIDLELRGVKDDLKIFNKRMDDLFNHTQYSYNKAIEAQNWQNRLGIDTLKNKLENIEVVQKDINTNLNTSKVLLKNATKYLEDAQNAYTKIAEDPQSLERDNNRLNETLENNFIQLTEIEDLVPQVQDHATNLSMQAQELDNLLTESRNISTNAVRAANAYRNIVNAVNKALTAAEDGDNAATEAVTLFFEVKEDTGTSNNISAKLLIEASNANEEVSNELHPNLTSVVIKSRPVRSLHDENVQRLNAIDLFLKQSPVTSDADLLQAIEIASDADVLAQNILNSADASFNDLNENKAAAEQLPNELENTVRDIAKARKQVQMVNVALPEITDSLREIPMDQDHISELVKGLNEKINIINQQIALARDVANRIKVGLKFHRNTTLELQNPPNLEDLSLASNISGYFRTINSNGLIFYLGNEVGTNLKRTTSDDYMALEVENGYLVLTTDIGNNPQRVVNTVPVSDGRWYHYLVERLGHNLRLTVTEGFKNGRNQSHTVSEKLKGPNIIFNLDRNHSKLFVGGHPPEFAVQDQVQQNSFEGEMEDLVIGDVPISLWNFKDGYGNNQGAISRDLLINLAQSTGFRFNGFGYVVIDARSFSLRTRSDVRLSFKTFAPNGLLFLVQGEGGKSFLSLELRDGRLIYQYNLGYETKLWASSRLYNEGNWHSIEATRDAAKGRFIIDDEDVPDSSSIVSGNSLDAFDTFFFGGYPRFHSLKEVTNLDFDGCIDNVTIMGNPVDLTYHIKAYGVTPGCPKKYARLVSFDGSSEGYIKSNKFSSGDEFQIVLRFRTKAKEGLIFFATDQYMSESVSLSVLDGKLVLISQKMQLETDETTYNDNDWHVVVITHNGATLRFDVDDFTKKIIDSPPSPIRVMYGDLYFGGLPSKMDLPKGLVATRKTFNGCIVDVIRDEQILNFADFSERNKEFLGKCVLDEPLGSETSVHNVPTLPPIVELGFGTEKPPEVKTEEPYEAGIPSRGDGGSESRPRETTTQRIEFPIFIAPGTIPPQVKPTTTQPSCLLPMVPAIDVSAPTRAFKYSAEKHSRSEYNTTRGKTRKQFDFTLEFKTTQSEGILFYVTNPTDVQYVGLYLHEGRLIYTFSGGSDAAIIRSFDTYNDGNWHHVNISRIGLEGRLVIDNTVVLEGNTRNTAVMQLYPPYYIGGVPSAKFHQVHTNLNTTANFDGCVNNFYMNGYVMENPYNVDVMQCLEEVEPGAFFGIRGGYLKLKDRFKVGLEIDIKMEIKPRNVSGLLISVHGRRDYLILEMVNGVIKLTVENGKGAITTSFQPDKPHYFCDGQWHNIQAVKSKNVVTLSVDSTFTDPGVGDYRYQSTDTGGALFLGGHRLIHKVRNLSTRSPFLGCIKDVYINDDPIHFEQKMAEGHVTVGSCPTV